ncbi:hypothetical protein QTH97_27860 [Variovorax sp. J22R24]|uniref:hypothetical protein n=1 Tax=Variovorax gracilis TaxID=3053502 RepID=UPI002575BB1C|nr:hypothetical protein [Variovorax sp. J22R24]MDM0108788.1 hypothetical protein [Variovorax sp. J22R24]
MFRKLGDYMAAPEEKGIDKLHDAYGKAINQHTTRQHSNVDFPMPRPGVQGPNSHFHAEQSGRSIL